MHQIDELNLKMYKIFFRVQCPVEAWKFLVCA